jgi:hypothetical protein
MPADVQLGVKALNPKQPVNLLFEDRRRHMYLLGKSGMGKSSLLQNMAILDISEVLSKIISSERKDDLIYFKPSDKGDNALPDFEKILQQQKIVLIDLAKGRIGVDKSEQLGKELMVSLQSAMFKRSEIPVERRSDYFVYVDEAQSWPSEVLEMLLSEGRKYRLSIVLSHQYLEQLSESLINAILGHAGNIIVFRIGLSDAERLAPLFAPTFTSEELMKLPTYHAAVQMLQNNELIVPFQMVSLPPAA